ncbi:MAG: translocation/assembly module TamB, partial [Deltaproteobacteria bacterium]
VATSAGAKAGQVAGVVDAVIRGGGQLEGDADVTLKGATVAGTRVERLHATAKIDARRGMDAEVALSGAYDAGGVSVDGLSVGASDGEYAVTLSPTAWPVGGVQARVRDLRVAKCAGERPCLVNAVKADVQLQPSGRVAWDVRAGAGGLETTLLGVAALPIAGRTLQVDLDRFTVTHVTDDGGRTDLLVADRLRYLGSGVIRVGELRLVGPDGASGYFRAQGTVDAVAGAVDLLVDARGIDLDEWVERYPRMAALVLAPKRDGEEGPDGFGLALPDVAGRVEIGGYVRGTLAQPELRVAVTLTDARLDSLRGLRLGTVLDWHGDRLSVDVGGSWHEGARFSVRGRVPMTLALAPAPEVTVDYDGPFSLEVEAKDADLTATQRFLAGVGASGRLEGKAMAGKASLTLKSKGSFRRPDVELTANGAPLTLGAFDGETTLSLISKEGQTKLTLDLDGAKRGAAAAAKGKAKAKAKEGATPVAWPERKPLADIEAVLPFDVAEVISARAPLDLVRQRLRDAAPEACRVDAQIGRMTLGETPAEPFLRETARAIEVVAQLHLTGPLSRLDVTGSRIELANAGFAEAGLVLDLKNDGSTVSALLSTSARGDRLLRGSLVVPDAGLLLAEPERVPDLLRNPRFKFALFSDDMTSAELWDFNQSLGELAAAFLPDARAMVHVNAHGGRKGPEANVLVRLRNGRRSARRGDSLDRNIADDLRLIVSVRPEKSSVVLRVTQDAKDVNGASADRPEDVVAARPVNGDEVAGDALPPECRVTAIGDAPYAMMVDGAVPLGSRALLDGALPDLAQLPLQVQIASCGLQLGRVVRALGATFGPSRGRLDGRVKLAGTMAAPTFAGSLTASFKQLDVDVIGFHRDQMSFGLTFDDRKIALVPIRLEGKPSAPAKGGEPAPSYLHLTMAAEVERLDAAGIRLDGALEMRDFPLVDVRDAKARVAGDVAVKGSVAQPDVSGRVDVLSGLYKRAFGARDVRPLGLPEDVTIVTGDPVPPPTTAQSRRLRTGAKLDVRVNIHEGKLVIENDMLRILPWTKDLRVQTVDGDVAITGTIFVPKEKITLYGKVFTVASDSRVVFTGDMSSDPQLLVSATYDISEVDLSPLGLTATADSRATVSITGNAAAPKLTLSSDPAMDESNIINVIVFDAPVGQGDSQDANVRNQVANLVIGLATGSLSRFVTEQLPIDTFQLDTKSGDLTESRLTVGKRLAKNLFFRYRRNIGADGETESANEFSAEYRVGPMTLLGNYGDIGEFSLEANLHVSN